MLKIRGLIATTAPDPTGTFTPECLKHMQEQIDKGNIPLTYNFNFKTPKAQIGTLTKAESGPDGLLVEAELWEESVDGLFDAIEHGLMYIVPGGVWSQDHSSVEMRCAAITPMPTDATLKPISITGKCVGCDCEDMICKE